MSIMQLVIALLYHLLSGSEVVAVLCSEGDCGGLVVLIGWCNLFSECNYVSQSVV